MIKSDELTSIGTIFKPHGIKGELSAVFDAGIMPDEVRCIVFDIDGIYVPFFIESSRMRGSEGALIKIEGVDDEKAAASFANQEIFAITAELPEDEDGADENGVYLYGLEGFELRNRGEKVGIINEIDDSTVNILFHVDNNGEIIFVPFAEDFIIGLDPVNNIIDMDLPDGIIDLNS